MTLIDLAIGWVTFLYCVAFWVQSRPPSWVRAARVRRIPQAWVVRE